MGNDFWIVVQWWGTLFLVGAVAFPLTKRLFSSWFDHGYLFSKAVGMAVVTWIVYAAGVVKLAPFTAGTIVAAMGIVFVGGLWGNRGDTRNKGKWKTIMLEELFFFSALLFWSWVKAHEPSIRGLEKFMDYGFMQSILNSSWFPAPDMWYAGLPINYYYFGHTVVAVLTKLSGIDLSYTFNLMLATIFALTLTMSFSIGKQISGGLLTAFLVTLAGNMQTLYAFTKGYDGEAVRPFWEHLGKMDFNRYWYANATRFIPFTIHEFPSYSFVVSDVHGHVLSIPFVLLAIAMLIQRSSAIFYGFLSGVLLMTNALDGPIYLGLFVVLSVKNWKRIGVTVGAAALTSLPFLWYFKSFVSGVAVNCPPAFLANTKFGPIIFEGVEKCQHSPLWMMAILWGFFWYCGAWLIMKKKFTHIERLLIVFFIFSLALIIFPEFFYFKDIYPAHFRSNTMFKLGYQAFIMFSILSGYTIVKLFKQKVFFLFLIPQLILVSIYPIFSIRSYFDSLRHYKGLNGLTWLMEQYPDDYKAIDWLKSQNQGTIVEADGDSYTDYARFSAFTGMPTIVGWSVHEWLWRGTYDVVAPRREEVRVIYESQDPEEVQGILAKYNVSFVLVGTLEREKYPTLVEEKFNELGAAAFASGNTKIYAIDKNKE